MQDKYAGDVGDFSKFALLRALEQELGARVGLIWYLFPNESTNDGRHTSYVSDNRWKRCDAGLVERIQVVLDSESRTVAALERAQILLGQTQYFSEPIHPCGRADWNRKAWFERAARAVDGCKVVMVDPDNGIAGVNHRPTRAEGGKHITLDEINHLANRHDCVVIYHHFDRSAPHPVQMLRLMQVCREVAPGRSVSALRYRRFSPRAYLIISTPSVEPQVRRIIELLSSPPWDFHFESADHLDGT